MRDSVRVLKIPLNVRPSGFRIQGTNVVMKTDGRYETGHHGGRK